MGKESLRNVAIPRRPPARHGVYRLRQKVQIAICAGNTGGIMRQVKNLSWTRVNHPESYGKWLGPGPPKTLSVDYEGFNLGNFCSRPFPPAE